MDDPLAARRERFLTLAADLPARCRIIERSEGNSVLRKLRKLSWFGARYVRWAAVRAGLHPGAVTVPLFWGGRMTLPYSDEADFVTFYLAGAPGGPEYKLARHFIRILKTGDSFYDAGANYGFYTLLASEFVGPEGEIHAFEPLPEIAAGLARNSPGPVARIVDAALWDRSGTATLHRHRLGNVFNTLEAEVAEFDPTRGPMKTAVRCITLDEYASRHRPPTVIKIDVEGGEKRLIAGGTETIRKARPMISMEVWGGASGERFSLPACQTLLELGYGAYSLNEDGTASPLAADSIPSFINSLPGAWDNLVFHPI